MLQKLDEKTINRLRVAEYLQNLDPTAFHMNFCTHCICGHINRFFLGKTNIEAIMWQEASDRAAEFLGLTKDQADELFAPGPLVHGRDHTPDPKDAARVMRYLAATDVVDWDVGLRTRNPLYKVETKHEGTDHSTRRRRRLVASLVGCV